MKGFFNKLLRISLNDRSCQYEDIPDELLRKTLGGKGLGTYYLNKENPEGIPPFSPENIFIIAVGPATGTKLWGQARFGVYSKSPATNGYGESYCGGSLALKIKGCGVDAIIVKGKCDELSYLVIDENGVTFNDAKAIKGEHTDKSETYILKHSSKGAGAITIGPAGENLVRFACIKSDRYRSLGRGGMGAVLGSKNIKGISFFGPKKTEIADQDLLIRINKLIAKDGNALPSTELYQQLGTPMMVSLLNDQNAFPTEYWKSGSFSKKENLSADYMRDKFDVKSHACPNCFLRCTKKSTIKRGRHIGLTLEGPEYETIYAFGGLNKIDSLEEVAYLNDVCDKLGLDTISAGNITAFAVEAYRRGKIDFNITYNQPDRIAELLELITWNKGIGKVLAKGIKDASEELSLEDIAIHVKGLEPAGYDPRPLKGMGLSYATSARGACHLRGTFYKAELSGQIDKHSIQGKAKLHIDYEDRCALFDSLILCRFFRDIITWDKLSMIIKAVTGMSLSKKDLEYMANDITCATRAYNKREGLDASTDTLPKRLLKEPTKQGDSLCETDLQVMIMEYNDIRAKRQTEYKEQSPYTL